MIMQEKLGLPAELQQEVVSEMVKAYVEGLCWVLAYYYEGVPQKQQLCQTPFQAQSLGHASNLMHFKRKLLLGTIPNCSGSRS